MKELNDLRFGNPTKGQKELIDKQCMVDDLFEEFNNRPFPDNDCAATRMELTQLVRNIKAMELDENKAYLKTYLALDRHLQQSIVAKFQEQGVDVFNQVKEIIEDIQPLCDKLRFFYNRPRPGQLANWFELNLFPFDNKSLSAPAYPPANTIQAIVVLDVLSGLHPDMGIMCRKIKLDAINSGVWLGQHFPSDNDFALEVSAAILAHPSFVRKYAV